MHEVQGRRSLQITHIFINQTPARLLSCGSLHADDVRRGNWLLSAGGAHWRDAAAEPAAQPGAAAATL